MYRTYKHYRPILSLHSVTRQNLNGCSEIVGRVTILNRQDPKLNAPNNHPVVCKHSDPSKVLVYGRRLVRTASVIDSKHSGEEARTVFSPLITLRIHSFIHSFTHPSTRCCAEPFANPSMNNGHCRVIRCAEY